MGYFIAYVVLGIAVFSVLVILFERPGADREGLRSITNFLSPKGKMIALIFWPVFASISLVLLFRGAKQIESKEE